MTVSISGTSGIVNDATDLNYTGTLTGGTGVVNLGSGQFYKDASGNVGIGTSSPAQKLHVVGNAFVPLGNSYYSYTADYGMGTPNSAGLQVFAATGDATGIRFGGMTSGTFTERARIDSSGNLLVGLTSISGAYGKITSRGITGVAYALRCDTGTTVSDAIVAFSNPNGVVGNISTSGSTTSYVTSSDYRLKEAIAPMTGALARVALLKPVTYKWKVDGSDGQGFIAHELAEVEAGCVTGEKDAVDSEGNPQYQGIDTSFLVATLAAAIQELKALVDEQSILIASQATRITALEGTAA